MKYNCDITLNFKVWSCNVIQLLQTFPQCWSTLRFFSNFLLKLEKLTSSLFDQSLSLSLFFSVMAPLQSWVLYYYYVLLSCLIHVFTEVTLQHSAVLPCNTSHCSHMQSFLPSVQCKAVAQHYHAVRKHNRLAVVLMWLLFFLFFLLEILKQTASGKCSVSVKAWGVFRIFAAFLNSFLVCFMLNWTAFCNKRK